MPKRKKKTNKKSAVKTTVKPKKVTRVVVPNYTEVTEEDRTIINQIQSPFTFQFVLCFLAVLAGIMFVIISYVVNVTGLLNIYYEIFGFIGIVLGLYGIYYLYKRSKQFKEFLEQDKFRIIWTYTEEQYKEMFNIYKETHEDPSKLSALIAIVIIIILTLVLYVTLNVSTRAIAIPFGLVAVVTVILTSYFLPKSHFNYAQRKPYIILIDDRRAYIQGEFYIWDECTTKLVNSSTRSGKEIVKFSFEFEEAGMYGRKERNLEIILPNTCEATIQLARTEAKRISKISKEIAQSPERKGDFLDRFFRKIVGR